jgi:hypothetical protein
VRLPQLPSVRLSDVAVRIVLALLATVFSPLMGSLLTGWFAYDADRNGRRQLRNLMIGLLILSLVGVFAYARLWGGIIFGA